MYYQFFKILKFLPFSGFFLELKGAKLKSENLNLNLESNCSKSLFAE